MISSRRLRIDFAIEILEGVMYAELGDAMRAKEIHGESEITEGMENNAECIEEALHQLKQVK